MLLTFVAVLENTDFGYASMSIGSHFKTGLVLQGGSDFLEVCNET